MGLFWYKKAQQGAGLDSSKLFLEQDASLQSAIDFFQAR